MVGGIDMEREEEMGDTETGITGMAVEGEEGVVSRSVTAAEVGEEREGRGEVVQRQRQRCTCRDFLSRTRPWRGSSGLTFTGLGTFWT